MSLWGYVTGAREFLSRHRRQLLIAAAVGAGTVCALAYVRFKPMFDQIRAELKMMEKLAQDMNTGEAAQQQSPPPQFHALLHRFNHNLAVCDQTLRNFAVQAKADVAARWDVVAIRSQIKRSSLTPSSSSSSATSSPPSSDEQSARERAHDLAKWNEFKLAGFSRTLTALYSITLLHALIKVQLSIVSRYVLSEQQPPPSSTSSPARSALGPVPVLGSSLTEEVNRAYFGLSEWAQREGLTRIGDAVSSAVTAEMTRWELNANCSIEDIQLMISHIRHRVDEVVAAQAQASADEASSALSAPASPFLSFVYPPPAAIEQRLEAMEPQLREAARAAIAASSAPASPAVPPASPLPTSSPSTLTNLATSRLHEMAAETLSVLHSETFALAVQSSLSSAFDVLLTSLLSSLPGGGTAMPFASVMVKMMKLFDGLLPDAGGGLYDALAANVQVREMCEVIYFPINEQGQSVLQASNAPPADALLGGEDEMKQLQALLTSAAIETGSGGGGGGSRGQLLPAALSASATQGSGEQGNRGGLPIRGVSGEGKFHRG